MGPQDQESQGQEFQGSFPCPFCSYRAGSREDFRAHLQEAHPDKAD